jgi:hypothetical protein
MVFTTWISYNKFHCAIKYISECASQDFANEVSNSRRAGDIDKAYELIAETMKLFGNSANGKTITNKERFKTTSYANYITISNKINNPRFVYLELSLLRVSRDHLPFGAVVMQSIASTAPYLHPAGQLRPIPIYYAP